MGARARPPSVPDGPASIQTWRETLNEHGRVMWRGQVMGHMSSLAPNPAAMVVNARRPGRSGQRRSVKQPFNRCFCSNLISR